jgi:hypothetical protein
MQTHIRNDVKPSVGRVVTLDWLNWVDVSSNSVDVVTSVNLGCYKPLFGNFGVVLYLYLN